jgi:glycerol uptake facilitator-like aquaporin
MIAGPITGIIENFLIYRIRLIILGGHMNPALSISLLTIRKLKPLQCLFYIIGQVLGGFLGAALVYVAYLKQFDEFDGGIRCTTGSNSTADVFFTMLAKGFPQWNAFVDQIICTAILTIFIMGVTHVRQLLRLLIKSFAFVGIESDDIKFS